MNLSYPRPSRGAHLTFINNYKVSQSDNDTIMLSMIVLNAKPYNNNDASPVFDLQSFDTSSDLATQFCISEVKIYIDTSK